MYSGIFDAYCGLLVTEVTLYHWPCGQYQNSDKK